jgi:hypothetical protein
MQKIIAGIYNRLLRTSVLAKTACREMESFTSKDKPRKALFFVAATLVFAAVYLLNVLYPYWSDDLIYSFKWASPGKNSGPITGFRDILESQYLHYFLWGGRTVAHTLLQTLLWWGKTYSDILNSLMFVIYTLSIYRIANLGAKKKYNLRLFILTVLLVWFLQTSFRDTVIWLTGSLNYMWMTVFALLFIYPYCRLYLKETVTGSPLYAALMFLCGVIVGWSHENAFIAALLFVFITLFLLYRKKQEIPLWAKIGLAGLLLGAAFLLFAPGNQLRLAESIASHNRSEFVFYRLCYGIYMVAYYFFYLGIPAITAAAGFYIVYKYCGKAGTGQYRVLACVFFASGAAVLFSMIASPVFYDRNMFGFVTFVIVGILLLYVNWNFKQPLIAKSVRILVPLLVLLALSQYFFVAKDARAIKRTADARERQIEEQKRQGITNIVIKEKQPVLLTGFLHKQELATDTAYWINRACANYYGVHTIRVEYEYDYEK